MNVLKKYCGKHMKELKLTIHKVIAKPALQWTVDTKRRRQENRSAWNKVSVTTLMCLTEG
jgi:hypothetical protein